LPSLKKATIQEVMMQREAGTFADGFGGAGIDLATHVQDVLLDSISQEGRDAQLRAIAENEGFWPPATQEEVADGNGLSPEPNWTFRTIHTGHWPMVSAPDELVELLHEAVRK
jgi:hypothetical protein